MSDLRLKSIEVVHAYLAEGRLTNCVNAEYLKYAPSRAGAQDNIEAGHPPGH